MNKTPKSAPTRRAFLRGLGYSSAGLALFGAQGVAAPPAEHYDVIVVGIGSGGFGAALAAARQGASVLAIELADEIGGNAVRGGVSMWEPGVGGTGFPFELYTRLKAMKHAVGVYSFGRHSSWDGRAAFPGGEHLVKPGFYYRDTLQRHRPGKPVDAAFRKAHWHGVIFEPAAYARLLRGLLAETGRCTLKTETTFASVEMEGTRILALTLTDGRRVTADTYIDSTGGGALAAACGATLLQGQESRDRFGEAGAPEKPNDRLNGVTLIFRIRKKAAPGIEPLPEGVPEACWWGNFSVMSAVRYPNGDYNCNQLPTMAGQDYVRLGAEKAYAECQRRIAAFWRHVQTGWPEFQDYERCWTAPALGVRETSRVLCEYMLREQDLLAGLDEQAHDDIVTIADHAFDRHGAGGHGGEVRQPYGIPFRSLLVKDTENLLVACRGAGFSSIAASSSRLSRTMMQLGQAAGTAAALAKERACAVRAVPPKALRNALRDQQCQLGFPLSEELQTRLEEEVVAS